MILIVCMSSSVSSLIANNFAVCSHKPGLALQMPNVSISARTAVKTLPFQALTQGGFIVTTIGFADAKSL